MNISLNKIICICILIIICIVIFNSSIIEKFVPYAYNTQGPPEVYGFDYVPFQNHNLTVNPRVSTLRDPTYYWWEHRPFGGYPKLAKDCDKCVVKHVDDPFAKKLAQTDHVYGYDSLCLKDYNCMVNYITPQKDLRF